jgi:hypothetical protein
MAQNALWQGARCPGLLGEIRTRFRLLKSSGEQFWQINADIRPCEWTESGLGTFLALLVIRLQAISIPKSKTCATPMQMRASPSRLNLTDMMQMGIQLILPGMGLFIILTGNIWVI